MFERAAADRAREAGFRHDHARARPARCGALGGEDGDERRGTLLQRFAGLARSSQPSRALSSSIAARMRSGVAGASSFGSPLPGAAAATAWVRAEKTEMASISGGSPTALERWIGGLGIASALPDRDLHARRAIVGGRDLVGGRRVGEQAAARVVDQFLRRQPAHALDEAALDLPQVDRRIERVADVVEDVDRDDLVLAGERVDHDLAERRAISEIEERAAAMAGPVIADVRSRVIAGRGERDAGEMGAAAELGEGPACRIRLGRRECVEALADRFGGILRGHAVQVGARRGGRRGGIGDLVGARRPRLPPPRPGMAKTSATTWATLM